MKNITAILLFSFISVCSFSQKLDRSVRPKAGPAPEVKIGDYESFTLKNGLKVFVIENHKLPRVTFNLILDKDPILEGDKSGYVSLAGGLLGTGTTTRTKEEIDSKVDFMGATISAYSSGVYASCLSKYNNDVLDLMSDIIINPSVTKAEFDKQKKQTISGLQASKDEPNSISATVQSKLLFGENHPYGEEVTEATVENITLEDCNSYIKTYVRPDIAYMAIIGDINMKDAKKMITKYFAKWENPASKLPSFTYETPAIQPSTSVALVNRDASVQSSILISNTIDLKPGSADASATEVLNFILGSAFSGRLFQNIREDKGYTYGAYSNFGTSRLTGTFQCNADVRTEVTDSAITEFMYELKRIANEKVSQTELDGAIANLTGTFAMSLEDPRTIGNFALSIERNNLPKDYYKNYLKRLSQVTIADVQRVAQKFILPENLLITVVGKSSEIKDKLSQFGPVQLYDNHGNVKKEMDAAIPTGMTSQNVLNGYIEAIGGSKAVEAVKNIQQTLTASMQGMDLEIKTIKAAPNKSFSSMSGMGMTFMSSVYDGKKAKVLAQGQPQEVSDEDLKAMQYDSYVIPELEYLSDTEVSTELIEVADVNGTPAFAVRVTFPTGKVVTNYYDTKTHLKLRETEIVESVGGDIPQSTEFENYKKVDGVLIPHTVVYPIGPQKMKAEISEVIINGKIDPKTFEIN